jgi:hypothetical protein
LEQPSFKPDPDRPKVVSGDGGNTAYGGDDLINPAFLTVSVAVKLHPQRWEHGHDWRASVKERFALSRLAWITYAGPITLDGSTYNPALASSYINALKTTHGFTRFFCSKAHQQISYKYFGLSWVIDAAKAAVRVPGDGQMKWLYDHSKSNPTSGVSSPVTALGNGGSIALIEHLGLHTRARLF